jgi:hypothetical protein
MNAKELYTKQREVLRSSKGRNILSFFVFLVIATIFWLLLALNDDVQNNYKLPVTIDGFPENATVLNDYYPTINVTVKGKGSSLLQFVWSKSPALKLRFDDFTLVNDSVLQMNAAQLNSAVRNLFGVNTTVLTMRPDSLRLTYTTHPGIRLPLVIKSSVRTLPQYAYSGNPICDVDSVVIYSNSTTRYSLHSISTKPIELANLSDTTVVEAALDVPAGMRAIPATVTVKFPIEPLVSKKRSVTLGSVNVPDGLKIVPFPSVVEVSYLIPQSFYNRDNVSINAVVDYSKIESGVKSLPVTLDRVPSYMKSVTVSPQKVDFVVEAD